MNCASILGARITLPEREKDTYVYRKRVLCVCVYDMCVCVFVKLINYGTKLQNDPELGSMCV